MRRLSQPSLFGATSENEESRHVTENTLDGALQSLSAPTLEDEETQRAVLMLPPFLYVCAFVAILTLFVAPYIHSGLTLVMVSSSCAAFLAFCLLSFVFMRTNKMRLAIRVFLGAALLFEIGMIISFGNLDNNLSMSMVLLTFIAGFVGGWRLGVGMGLLSTLTGIGAYAAQHMGLLTPAVFPHPMLLSLFVFLLCMLTCLCVLVVSVRRMNEALFQAKHELSERNQVEEALRKTEELFSRAFHSSPAPMLISLLDENKIIDANDTFLKICGLEREDLGSRLSDTLGLWLDPDAALRTLAVVKEQGAAREIDCTFITKSGEHRKASISAEITEIGGRRCIVWQGMDITERKLVEEQIRDLNTQLEQRVSERTQQLESANQELKSFTYTVSHDLRTPLRAIEGFSRILLEDFSEHIPPESLHFLRLIHNSTEKMDQLINSLLAFSRVGAYNLERQNTSLGRLAREFYESIQHEIDTTKVEFTIGDMPFANVDPHLFQQVLANLISNSLKFSGHQPLQQIEFGAAEIGNQVVYFLKDNGVGFDMQYANKVFEVFHRLHSQEEYEGTGAGLAIVHRIIERHGGKIWVESAPNQGTTFFFTVAASTETPKYERKQTQPSLPFNLGIFRSKHNTPSGGKLLTPEQLKKLKESASSHGNLPH